MKKKKNPIKQFTDDYFNNVDKLMNCYSDSEKENGLLLENDDGSSTYISPDSKTILLKDSDGTETIVKKDSYISQSKIDGSQFYADRNFSHYYKPANEEDTDYPGEIDSYRYSPSFKNALNTSGDAFMKSLIESENRRRKAEESAERIREKKQENKIKRKEFFRKHWKLFICLVLVISFGLTGYYFFDRFKKSIPVGSSSDELIGLNIEVVKKKLSDNGFVSINQIEEADLDADHLNLLNTVSKIEIENQDSFTAGHQFPFDASVKVYYHTPLFVQIPYSSKELSGKKYTDVVAILKSAGFYDITTVPLEDLKTGWINKPDTVDTVLIENTPKFTTQDQFRINSTIIINYHSFKDND